MHACQITQSECCLYMIKIVYSVSFEVLFITRNFINQDLRINLPSQTRLLPIRVPVLRIQQKVLFFHVGSYPFTDFMLVFCSVDLISLMGQENLLNCNLFSFFFYLVRMGTDCFQVFFCFRNLMVKRMTSCLHQLGVFDCN